VEKDITENLAKVVCARTRLPTLMVVVGAILMIVAYAIILYGALYMDLPEFNNIKREQAILYGNMGVMFGILIGAGGILMLKNSVVGGLVTLALTILGFALRLISFAGIVLFVIGGILGLLCRKDSQEKNRSGLGGNGGK